MTFLANVGRCDVRRTLANRTGKPAGMTRKTCHRWYHQSMVKQRSRYKRIRWNAMTHVAVHAGGRWNVLRIFWSTNSTGRMTT